MTASATPFEARGGIASCFVDNAGSAAVALGSISAGHWVRLFGGDSIALRQSNDFTTDEIVHFLVNVTARTDPRANWTTADKAGQWTASAPAPRGVMRLPPWLALERDTANCTARQSATSVQSGYAPNTARAYSADGSTWGLLIEPSMTNLVDAHNLNDWTGAANVSSVEGPDGVEGWYGLEDDAAGAAETRTLALTGSYSATDRFTGWIYNESAPTNGAVIEMSPTGEFGSSVALDTWTFVDVAMGGSGSNPSMVLYPRAVTLTDTGVTRFWGLQYEQRAYSTSFHPRETGGAARAADTLWCLASYAVPDGYANIDLTFKPMYAHTGVSTNDHTILWFAPDCYLHYDLSATAFVFVYPGGSLSSSSVTFSADQSLTVSLSMSETATTLTVSGATTGNGTATASVAAPPIEAGERVFIMGGPDGAEEGAQLTALDLNQAAPDPWKLVLEVDGVERYSTALQSSVALTDLALNINESTEASISVRLVYQSPAVEAELVELPLALIDQTGITNTSSIEAHNRWPENAHIDVEVDRTIRVDLFSLTDNEAVTIDASQTTITVNGTAAYTGGAFQTGFDGPGSTASYPQFDVLRLTIDPTTDLDDDTTIAVEIETENAEWLPTIYAPFSWWSPRRAMTVADVGIESIADEGTVGGTMAQSTDASQPTLDTAAANDKASLDFDATDDWMQHSTAVSNWDFLHDGSPSTLLFAFYDVIPASDAVVFGTCPGTANTDHGISVKRESGGGFEVTVANGSGSAFAFQQSTTETYDPGFHVLAIRQQEGAEREVDVFVDGVRATLGSNDYADPPASGVPDHSPVIGRQVAGGALHKVDWLESIVLVERLTEAEIKRATSAMTRVYGASDPIEDLIEQYGGFYADFSPTFANASTLTLRKGATTYGSFAKTGAGTLAAKTASNGLQGIDFTSAYYLSGAGATVWRPFHDGAGFSLYVLFMADNLDGTTYGLCATHNGGNGAGSSISLTNTQPYVDPKTGNGAASVTRPIMGTPFAPNINPDIANGQLRVVSYRASTAGAGRSQSGIITETSAVVSNPFAVSTDPQSAMIFGALGGGASIFDGSLYRVVGIEADLSASEHETVRDTLLQLTV